MKAIVAKGMVGLGVLASFALGGCATELGEDDIELRTGAFNASQCSTASPVATYTGQYVWNSPASYGGACNAVDETSGGNSSYLPYGASVSEAKLPKTQAACQSVTIRSVFYRKYMGNWVIQKDEAHSGVWGPRPFGGVGCSLQGTSFPVPGVPGVRVATTVRSPSGGSFVTYPFTTSFLRAPR